MLEVALVECSRLRNGGSFLTGGIRRFCVRDVVSPGNENNKAPTITCRR